MNKNGTTRALSGATPDFNFDLIVEVEIDDYVNDDEPIICHLLADDLQWRRHGAGFAATTACGITDTWDTSVSPSQKAGPRPEYVDCPLCDGVRGGSL